MKQLTGILLAALLLASGLNITAKEPETANAVKIMEQKRPDETIPSDGIGSVPALEEKLPIVPFELEELGTDEEIQPVEIHLVYTESQPEEEELPPYEAEGIETAVQTEYYDKFGRLIKTESTDGTVTISAEKEYDLPGRLIQSPEL